MRESAVIVTRTFGEKPVKPEISAGHLQQTATPAAERH